MGWWRWAAQVEMAGEVSGPGRRFGEATGALGAGVRSERVAGEGPERYPSESSS